MTGSSSDALQKQAPLSGAQRLHGRKRTARTLKRAVQWSQEEGGSGWSSDAKNLSCSQRLRKDLAGGAGVKDVSCDGIGIKDFSRVCSLSHYMNGGPFAEMGTLGDQTYSFLVCGEKEKRESALYLRNVTFQTPVQYPREDADSQFINVKLSNTSMLEIRNQGKKKAR